MLLYPCRVKAFLSSLIFTLTLSASIVKSADPGDDSLAVQRSNFTLAAVEENVLLFRDCPVPNSNINVRYALRSEHVSALRMHDMIIGAMEYAYNKLMEGGSPRDRPLEPDELPFEYDGTGASQWYYTDIEQTPPGILTWQKVRLIFEGLLLCTFRRRQYYVVHFEVFEYTNRRDPPIRIGFGDLGIKLQATAQ